MFVTTVHRNLVLHLLFNTGTHLCHSIFQSYIIAYYVGCGGDRWQIRCWTCPGWTIRQRTCELFLDKYAVIRGVFATSEVYWHIDHALATRISKMDRSCWIFVTTQQPRRKAVLSVISSEGNEVFWIGLGITLYGFTYFIVHDVFIHQRIKWFRRSDALYFKAIRKAHKVHHKHLQKEEGECFGMLWVPIQYFKEAKNSLM